MKPSPPEFGDMQGLLRFGFGHLSRASFLLLKVRDRDAARAWLASVSVTSALRVDPVPSRALQVALSSDGMRALGVAPDVIDAFANEFVVGMSRDPGRSRRLGDVATSDPAQWVWGNGDLTPDAAVLLYANADLPAELAQLREQCAAGFSEIAVLDSAEVDGREPFGFADGISQPELDWDRRRPVRDQDELAYGNLSCLGEFVLGYPNEYGGYTDRPLLPAQGPAVGRLAAAEDAPGKLDLGRNGSYLILRQLRQDVHGFWRYLDQQAGGDPVLRGQLASAMVGRTPTGEPIVDPGGAPGSNSFTYASDPHGRRCPLGAHMRRSNPRNADLPHGTKGLLSRLTRILGFDAAALEVDHVASTRFHRLLRRGRKYGPKVPLAAALDAVPALGETGLYFVCLNGNISRQFEFVQSAWIANTKFDALIGEGDPLLGHRQSEADGRRTDVFSIPQSSGADRRLTGLPSFVTVRGGAYFFLPGLRALRYLATAT
jgi:deferrochelatase/peroxidase EfeB